MAHPGARRADGVLTLRIDLNDFDEAHPGAWEWGLRRLVATMPIEHLLLETDSPDQPDAHWRGQRNEPARLPAVLDAIAGLRGEAPEAIAAATTANAERLFGITAA